MEWVYPWDDSNFSGKQYQKEHIYLKLHEAGYRVDDYRKPPGKKLRRLLTARLDELWGCRQSNAGIPWMLLVCNSARVLQVLANVVPMAWALTLKESVRNITTDRLVSLFRAPTPRDLLDDDPVGEELYAISGAGMLVWERPEARVYGSATHEGEYLELLKNNFASRKRGLLLTYYMEARNAFVEEDTAVRVEEILEKNLGPSFGGMIHGYAVKRMLYVPEKPPSWVSSRL